MSGKTITNAAGHAVSIAVTGNKAIASWTLSDGPHGFSVTDEALATTTVMDMQGMAAVGADMSNCAAGMNFVTCAETVLGCAVAQAPPPPVRARPARLSALRASFMWAQGP